eukprot:4437176-Ditylum_brightwellii.AAC.1
MKRGGQNQHIATDPVHYPILTDILPWVIPGGYLAVVNISKIFYHFPTSPADHPYPGLIHPVMLEHY